MPVAVTTVRVRYFASARAAAGVESEALELPAGATVADAVAALRTRHPGSLPRILDAASFLVDGVAVRDAERPLPAEGELDVLPPFAGG
ncbi:Molybdopterin converting factor, small subunit [Prauserella flava]|nr:Molybdopterin converting factor, small subunit [Prauserella flava]MCR3735196.1 Molybdopterin converting factor, small subunit [Prauserella salsuginis]